MTKTEHFAEICELALKVLIKEKKRPISKRLRMRLTDGTTMLEALKEHCDIEKAWIKLVERQKKHLFRKRPRN